MQKGGTTFACLRPVLLLARQRKSRQNTRWNIVSGEHLGPHCNADIRGEEKDMSKERSFSDAWMVGLALALAVVLEAPDLGQTVMAADGNHLTLEAPSEVRQNETVELIAVVRDSQGRPVNGVPVGFRAESGWEKNIIFT